MNHHRFPLLRALSLAGLSMLPLAVGAQEADPIPTLDAGNTAWMLTATALVLFMTIPGLALFYGGMVRSKNVMSILMQCFAITALVSVLWVVYGYSLAFDTTGMEQGVVNFNSFVGGLSKGFMSGLTRDGLVGTIPESVFVTF
ncbi:MAG: ammonia channel protein, partial [Candidatus Macondimonas sp.]